MIGWGDNFHFWKMEMEPLTSYSGVSDIILQSLGGWLPDYMQMCAAIFGVKEAALKLGVTMLV